MRCGLLLAVACALMGAPARAQTPSNGTPPAPAGKEAVPGGKDPAPVAPNDRLGPNEGPKEVEGPKVLPKAADAPKVEPADSKTDAAKTGEQPKSADAGKTGEAADAAKTGEPPKSGAADGAAGGKTGDPGAKTEADGDKSKAPDWDKQAFPHDDPAAGDKTAAAAKADAEKSPDFSDGLTKIVISLVVIVAIFAAFIWFIRRNPKTRKFFGGGPVKVISRTYIAPRNAMFLVKVGDRVLVIGQSGTEGMRTLSEITDPAEVARLLATAEEANPAGMSATFRDALRSVTGGKTGGPGGTGTVGGSAAPVITAAPLSARSSQANDSAPSRRASLPPVQSPAADAPPSRVGRKLSVSADEEISVPPMPASRRQKDAEDQTVDPNYSAQLKLAAIRSQLERTKATLK